MYISDYFYWQQYYERIHGPNAIVLYQVGNFYEVYEYDPINCNSEEDKIDNNGIIWDGKVGHAIHIANTLNIPTRLLIRHDNYSIKNCTFTGFPVIHLNDKLNTLLNNGYTCITMDQKLDHANPAYPHRIIRCEDKIYHPII